MAVSPRAVFFRRECFRSSDSVSYECSRLLCVQREFMRIPADAPTAEFDEVVCSIPGHVAAFLNTEEGCFFLFFFFKNSWRVGAL